MLNDSTEELQPDLNPSTLLDFRTQAEQTLYFEVTDFLAQAMNSKGSPATTQFAKRPVLGAPKENNMTRKKDQILVKLKAFVKISRDYLEFLKHDNASDDGVSFYITSVFY
jgi:hypothetical protein